MKICPTCQKTYTDEGINFCLEDGSVLSYAESELPETVMIRQPPRTSPSPVTANQPAFKTSWDNKPTYSMQPKASSRKWPWVVGLLGIGLLLCGGGAFVVAFLFLIGQSGGEDGNITVVGDQKPPTSPFPDPTNANIEKIDLSEWVGPSEYGTTAFDGGEFIMSSRRAKAYFAMTALPKSTTESAATRVTLRNIEGAATTIGYGLIFHSNPKPLQQGYAFLIDTKERRYRVARHEPQKETDVVRWTSSSLIKQGKTPNIIEARHKNDIVELYINGHWVTSIRNTYGYKNGVAGLYVSDALKIGFRDLEIAR
jgi:hypothetical protein